MAGRTRTIVEMALGLTAAVLLATPVFTATIPQAVSPGLDDGVGRVPGVCPTFSWAGVENARAYELVIYDASSGVEEAGLPAAAARVPGSASSWTPSLGQCLEPGRRYVWFVRVVGEGREGAWSEGRVFDVAAAPTLAEVEQALTILQRYLERGSETDEPRSSEPSRDDAVSSAQLLDEAAFQPRDGLVGAAEAEASGVEIAETTITIAGLEVVTTATDRDTLGGMSCADDQLAKWNASLTMWECGDDGGGTSYLPGNQLTLDGSTFNVVEGPGSGLDADTLDGQNSAAFAESSHLHSGSDITSGTVAEPRIDPLVARDSEIIPTMLAGDGAGSGLDADLLDGQDSAAFAESSHAHSGSDITSGTVAEPRIDPLVARDSEIVPTMLAGDGAGSGLDADLLDGQEASAFAGAAHGHSGADITSGTVAEPRIDALVARDSEIVPAVLASDGSGSGLDADLLDGQQATAFAGASHGHSGADITSGTVAEPWIDALVARDSEIVPTVLAADGSGSGLDADLLDGQQASGFAGASHGHSGADITSGTVAEPRIDALVARDSEIVPTVLGSDGSGSGFDADLLDGLDGSAFVRTIGDTMTGQLTLQSDLALAGKIVKGGVGFLSDDGAGGNLALGREGLQSNATGTSNTAIGYLALRRMTEASGNTALGSRALRQTAGSSNTAVGINALTSDWNSTSNTAVGAYALENSIGFLYEELPEGPVFISHNTALGSRALRDNVEGTFNTAVGAHALSENVRQSNSTAVGADALGGAEGGSNTAVGYESLRYTTGYFNTALGSNAGNLVRSGWHNIMIGNRGETTDEETIRLGIQGTQMKTFIAGIAGTNLSGTPVVVTSEGQLGVASGSGMDADTLDGLDSTQFLRTDVPGTVTASVVGDETLAVVKGSGASPSGAALGVMNTTDYGEAGWFKLSDPTNTLPAVKMVLETGSSSDFLQCDLGGTKCRIDKNGTFISRTFRLQPTDSPPSCGSVGKGGLYYDTSLDEICLCNGTSWRQLDGGGGC